MAHLRVTWARYRGAPRVRVGYPNGLTDEVAVGDLAAALPRGAEVHGYFRDGPHLLAVLVAARAAGYVRRVVLRPYLASHPFVRTEIVGTHELTARLWAARTPEALVVHPVFARLSPFLPLGSAGALATLITTVFDPRWYADPWHPDRWSRLEQALALSPRGDRPGCPRRAVVRGCWAAHGAPPGVGAFGADFFGRRHAALLAAGVSEEVAVRKVGRLLVRAAVAAWLEAGVGGDPAFDPPRLFDAAAVEATRP